MRQAKTQPESGMAHKMPPTDLIVVDSVFEDIMSHAWSSALSVGHFVSSRVQSEDSPPIHEESLQASTTQTSQLLQYKDLHDSRDALHMSVIFNRNRVRRCFLGIVACDARLEARENEIIDIGFNALQLCDINADVHSNIFMRCDGPAIAMTAMMAAFHGGAHGRFSRNTYRACGVGIRLTSSQGIPCSVSAQGELLEDNGDGVVILSPKCQANFVQCSITRTRRCGARIGRGAQGSFERCNIFANGRGIAVASTSAAKIRNCNFSGNVGWAVRLEDAPSAANASTSTGSVVAGNFFGCVQSGNVGRKRIRIDAWDEGRALTEGNLEDDGSIVQPLLKRHRNLDEEADDAADRLGKMSLEASG
jgi:hypothetical protein